MKIGIDARMLAHSGIGTYLRQLLSALAAEPGSHRYRIFTAPQLVDQVPKSAAFTVQPATVEVYSPAEHGRWRRQLEDAGCDVYHVPHYNLPLGFAPPAVVTVHDLIHWLFPQFLRTPLHARIARALLRHAATHAGRVATDSACTSADLQRLVGVSPERVEVVYPGVDERFRPCAAAAVSAFRERLGLPRRFVLYVGLRRPHKNLPRLVRAFARYRARHPDDVQLVLWGRPDDRDAATLAAIAATGTVATVRCMHSSIADREMPLLYNAACGVVQPSLYEGFGLPALEAMACAVPVLAARGGALPEVVGDAALLVDPLDEVAMAEGLERLVGDGAERTERVERGLLRARRFDWTQAARQLRALYETA